MLAGGKIDSLDTHLEQFKLNNRTAQNDLESLLHEYGQLLDDYKDLKRAFEAKGTKAAAKNAAVTQLPPAKPHDPYVLVLVDGNGYIFNDELILDKEEGGMRAARMLNDAVEQYLQKNVPAARTSRVVLRVFADLTNLSKQLAKSKLTGMEKRSIAPFAAAFTRAISFFDFIDTLDEEGTKFKIREQFKIASQDDACSHILYAACHDKAYLSQLAPLSGLREKVTLVQGTGWNSEFHHFNLNVTQFPTVFRWLELPSTVPVVKLPQANGVAPTNAKKAALQIPTGPRHTGLRSDEPTSSRSSLTGGDKASSVTNGFDNGSVTSYGKVSGSSKPRAQLCNFFQKGFCRFDDKCTFQHVPPSFVSKDNKYSSSPKNPAPSAPKNSAPKRSKISVQLPTSTDPGYISLNKHSQRLDNYIRPPTKEEWSVYWSRFHQRKPCNSFHLKRVCTTFACPYDHQDLEPESRHVLEYVLKCSPCPKKSECRSADCFYGHICQMDGCQGLNKGCKIKTDLHSVDPIVASVVLADDAEQLVHDEGTVGRVLEGGFQAGNEGVPMPDEGPDEDGFNW
ncbi:hypothetical protein BDU57DRAFT_374837 [Ampelomyces quisqualis]|uniref:C3H1-type domain-containing protein n=1 Tax=Ampelomyces quisqualis TaxID=50730 RepID=A0A6A5QCU1_AMPQU|nr:hypothetical protein BDU57DRAFT_374837 [Ampelomyces quisqualis]